MTPPDTPRDTLPDQGAVQAWTIRATYGNGRCIVEGMAPKQHLPVDVVPLDEFARLRTENEALTVLAGANENTMRQWEGEANRLRAENETLTAEVERLKALASGRDDVIYRICRIINEYEGREAELAAAHAIDETEPTP